MTEKIHHMERVVDEHERKEEYRQYYHMQQLRYEASENTCYNTHFNHIFGWDKITKYIF